MPANDTRADSFLSRLLHPIAKLFITGAALWSVTSASGLFAADAPRAPNVVLIITDDQGYGDLSCHGNGMLQTPNLDALYRQSARLTNFHVDPTCAETRSALMTGRYSCRTGVWHTIQGRSLLRRDEITMPQFFKAVGYRTGQFGKWHLGDNYPYRPHDRGFDVALYHGGGGVSQTPDIWGNDYFDDTYLRNGKPEKQTGYCTDNWFSAATKFIDESRSRPEPFFCYIATNAPHSPYNVEDRYRQPYLDRGVKQPQASFYGMIANIDENVGRLLKQLDDWKLSDDTIVIYMTDNGSAEGTPEPRRPNAPANAGWNGFDAGMRGQKGSEYEGGHRVPCFVRWPGKIPAGEDFPQLAAHFDLLPTLWDWCDLGRDSKRDNPQLPPVKFDGRSLAGLLTRKQGLAWAERTLVVHSQRMEQPQKWHKTAVMTERLRLVDNKELYDVVSDPGQQNNFIGTNPQALAEMRKFYDAWWEDVSKRFAEPIEIVLGAEAANPATLTCHDWHDPEGGPFPFAHSIVARDPRCNGHWTVNIERAGKYVFTLRDRPSGVSKKLSPGKAQLTIQNQQPEVVVPEGVEEVRITLELKTGNAQLRTTLTDDQGRSHGAYFVTVERLE